LCYISFAFPQFHRRGTPIPAGIPPARPTFVVRAFPNSTRVMGRAIGPRCRPTSPFPAGPDNWYRPVLCPGPFPCHLWGAPTKGSCGSELTSQGRSVSRCAPWRSPQPRVRAGTPAPSLMDPDPWDSELARPARGSPTHSKGVSVPGPHVKSPTRIDPMSDPSRTVSRGPPPLSLTRPSSDRAADGPATLNFSKYKF
jgi:hypothetical protein